MVSYIYILQLQHGCFYVGKSDNPYKRLTQHKNGRGSAWTRLHKPIRMVKKRKMTSTLQEDQITEEWMKKKGIDKVRGGMYCQIELPDHVEETLTTKLFHAKNACLRCGSSKHFVKQCTAKEECEKCSFTGSYQQVTKHKCRRKRRRKSCARCGRDSHTESSCYAKTTIDGDSLDSSEEESDDESEDESDDEVYDDTRDRMVKKRRR